MGNVRCNIFRCFIFLGSSYLFTSLTLKIPVDHLVLNTGLTHGFLMEEVEALNLNDIVVNLNLTYLVE